MSLPLRLTAGSHVLYLSGSLPERLSLYENLLTNAVKRGRRLVALVDPQLKSVFETTARLAHLRARQLTIVTVDDLVAPDDGWQEICAGLEAAVVAAERSSVGWRLDEPESETLVFVDLDRVFARCNAASEMMSVVYTLEQSHSAVRRSVVEVITLSAIPRSMPAEFFDVHSDWHFSPGAVPGVDDGAHLDLSALRLALETPEFRHQFLALARADTESAVRLVPRFFSDYRRGFLLLDLRFTIRYCSPRAAALLGRGEDDLADRPLNTCVDGVDLVTLKHECSRVGTGDQSPFVLSWRLAPGDYEPRAVAVDAVTSEHRVVGYIVSLASVEGLRGPRAVYRRLSEDQSVEPVVPTEDEEVSVEDALSDSLHGTQITRREHEVMLLILTHRSNRDIARHLKIAEVTVKKHLTSIYRKLRITNRAELVRSFAPPNTDGQAPDGASE